MKVSEIMSSNPTLAQAGDAITAVANRMANDSLGFLPVVDNDRLVGVVTDRDLVVRHVATGKGDTVRDVMSGDVRCCAPHDSADDVIADMGRRQIRRIPVVDNDRVVGIVSLADAARDRDPSTAGSALGAVTQPGGEHAE